MRNVLKVCVLAAGLLAAGSPASAATVTFTLLGEVLSGPIAGTTGTGSFTFDDSLITGVGVETIRASQGLEVEFTFLGHTFVTSDDTDFPDFPLVEFLDGVLQGLDYLVENGDGVGTEISALGVQEFRTFPLEPIGPGAFFMEVAVRIPEPGSLALLLVGGAALVGRRRSIRRV